MPLEQLEAWIKARVPSGMAPNLGSGMEAARHKLARKTSLSQSADIFVAAGMVARTNQEDGGQ